MLKRLYEVNVGIETTAQPDAGSPAVPNDLITLGYLQANYEPKRTCVSGEVPTGLVNSSNTDFVLANTPKTGALRVFIDGVRITAYTLSVATITFSVAPVTGQVVEADYSY